MTPPVWEKLYANDFKDFVANIEKWSPDYFIPVARKACKLLKTFNLPLRKNNIFYRKYFEFRPNLNLEDRKIAVIDDSCHARAALFSYRLFFEKRKAKVRTFAFAGLKLEPSKGEFSYDPATEVHQYFTLPLYKEYLIQQDEFFLNQGTPLEIDHLTLQIEIPINDYEINTFLTELKKYGYLYYVDHQKLPPSFLKFTLDQPYFNEMKYFPLHSTVKIEGARKIRFLLNRKLEKLYCIPMIFPSLPSNLCFPHSCPLGSHVICINKLLASTPKSGKVTANICYHCLLLHLNAALGKELLSLITSESLLKFRENQINVLSLDYKRFFGNTVANKIVEKVLDFIQPNSIPFNKDLAPLSNSNFLKGTCSPKSIYLIRSDLHKKYKEKKRRLKTALNVHYSLSFEEILTKYKPIPPWYLSQNLDPLCDHDILVPLIERKKGKLLRTYRTGENHTANKKTLKVERTKHIIPFTIATAVESLKLSEPGLRPFFLTKLLVNLIVDHKKDTYTKLHCLQEKPYHYGPNIFADEPELTGGIEATLNDCKLMGDKYYKEDIYKKGRQYRIYRAKKNWDIEFGHNFSDHLKYELLNYLELLFEISKLHLEEEDVSTDPLVSLSINRTPDRFCEHILWNIKAWFGVVKIILNYLGDSDDLNVNSEMVKNLKHLARIKSQPFVKIRLYRNFPSLVENIDKKFRTSVKFGSIYNDKIKPTIFQEPLNSTKIKKISVIAKLQNAVSDLLLSCIEQIYNSISLKKDIDILSFDIAWQNFSSLYEKIFAETLSQTLKPKCLANKEDFINLMNQFLNKLRSYPIDILLTSEQKSSKKQIDDYIFQRAGVLPIRCGVKHPVYIIADMTDSKVRYIEMGLTNFESLADHWATVITECFNQFNCEFIQEGDGDKLFVGFFPNIQKTVEAVANLYEFISFDKEYQKNKIWPVHMGVAAAETLDVQYRNNSHLKVDVANKCCNHKKSKQYLVVPKDFVEACPPNLQSYFVPLQPACYITEMDKQQKMCNKEVYYFRCMDYLSRKQNPLAKE